MRIEKKRPQSLLKALEEPLEERGKDNLARRACVADWKAGNERPATWVQHSAGYSLLLRTRGQLNWLILQTDSMTATWEFWTTWPSPWPWSSWPHWPHWPWFQRVFKIVRAATPVVQTQRVTLSIWALPKWREGGSTLLFYENHYLYLVNWVERRVDPTLEKCAPKTCMMIVIHDHILSVMSDDNYNQWLYSLSHNIRNCFHIISTAEWCS